MHVCTRDGGVVRKPRVAVGADLEVALLVALVDDDLGEISRRLGVDLELHHAVGQAGPQSRSAPLRVKREVPSTTQVRVQPAAQHPS